MSARSAECRCDQSFTCGFCLRNAKPALFTPRTAQEAIADAPREYTTKLSAVRAAMAAGDWRRAVALAARFPQLGDERAAILDAHMAWTNPGFVRGLRKDPELLKAAGAIALRQKYGA
jgi:hypothetical protein